MGRARLHVDDRDDGFDAVVPAAGAAVIRLAAYAAALVIFGDMLIKSIRVEAYSFVLPLAALCIWLLVLIVRRHRQELRRLRRKKTDFIRPRSFPAQPKRGPR